MSETTTTTTKVETTTTTTQADAKKQEKPSVDSAGNSADNTNNPSRAESLKAAGEASPNAPDAGLKDGTKVLGSEGQSAEDRLDSARREGLKNAEGDQDLHAQPRYIAGVATLALW